jgi:hypothetical protein
MLPSNTSMESLGRSVILTAVVVFMGTVVGFSQAAEAQSRGRTPMQLKLWGDCALFRNIEVRSRSELESSDRLA